MKFFSLRDSFPELPSNEELNEFFADHRLWVLGDLIPDGLVVVDRTGLITYMNTTAESMNEVPRSVLVGQHLRNLVNQTQIVCESLMDDFAEGLRTTRITTDSGGREYTLMTRSLCASNGDKSHFLIIIRNNSPRASSFQSLPRLKAGEHHEGRLRDIPEPGEDFLICKDTSILIERGIRALRFGARVLLLGESGVGKSQLARYLHEASGLGRAPFVHINCGSIPDTLFESEMFGYERGSFTGASTRGKKGLIEEADGGTLFLDEVAEIPLSSQAKMLQVLEEGIIQRIGSTTPRRVQLKIIAATNCDLQEAVHQGAFRRDLYHRLNVITFLIPPLRQRQALLLQLIDHFLKKAGERRSVPLRMDGACRTHLQNYGFPGNIRELQNVIEYLSVVCEDLATSADLPVHQMELDRSVRIPMAAESHPPVPAADSLAPSFDATFDLRAALKEYEHQLIQAAIDQAGSKRAAARLLKVDIATVVRKTRDLNID